MNPRNKRKLAGLYLKQGCISLLLLIVTIYLGIVSSLTQSLFPATTTDITVLASPSFVKNHPLIQIDCDTLYYTGYDNRSGKKVTGHYYYTIQNNYCLFLLLDKTDNPPKEKITNYTGTFRLTEDEALYHNLVQSLAEDMDWSSHSLQEISIPVIASQPDYHLLPVIIFTIVLFICILVFTYAAISNFYYYYKYF